MCFTGYFAVKYWQVTAGSLYQSGNPQQVTEQQWHIEMEQLNILDHIKCSKHYYNVRTFENAQ